MVWPFPNSKERLRREAADWLARQQGPDAGASREAFDRWYRSSPDRAAAFDRIKSSYEAAGLLRQSDVARSRSLPGQPRRAQPLVYAFAAAAVGAALLVLLLLGAKAMPYRLGTPAASERYAAAGHDRRVALRDGSEVRLAAGSLVLVELGPAERRLRLLQGEAIFSVAHEARPFVVVAGTTQIVAHGTRFTVRLAGRRTTVALIEGSIDVTYSVAGSAEGQRRTRRLQPGERLLVDAVENRVVPLAAAKDGRGSSAAMLDFDDTPLSAAVDRANARGRPSIRLGQSALGSLRVTGAFRAGDNESFAQSLAAAFGLKLTRSPDNTLLLTPAAEAKPEQ